MADTTINEAAVEGFMAQMQGITPAQTKQIIAKLDDMVRRGIKSKGADGEWINCATMAATAERLRTML